MFWVVSVQVEFLTVIILRLRVRTEVFVEDQVIYLHIGEFSVLHRALHLYTSAAFRHNGSFLPINKHYTFSEGKKIWEISVNSDNNQQLDILCFPGD